MDYNVIAEKVDSGFGFDQQLMKDLGISDPEITLQKKHGTGKHYVFGNGTYCGEPVGFHVRWDNDGRRAQVYNPAPEECFKK